MHISNYRIHICKKGFTLIELLVVIAIIALLMSILMPALNRVKLSAKAAACQSNLHQWGIIWMTYAQDHEGRFQRGAGGESQTGGGRWPAVVRDYYKDDKIRLCPMATKTRSDIGVGPLTAWGGDEFDDDIYASYGFNEWLCNRPLSESETENYWRFVFNIPQSNTIPLFLDCFWYDVWAHSIDVPPQTETNVIGAGSNEMRRVCLNRHNYAVNGVFLDWSVRKIDLKELWTLKWHKQYNTRDVWTLAGGVTEDRWPEWMQGLKAY